LVGKVEFLSMEPVKLAAKFNDEGAHHIYVIGGVTIQRFMHARLIDELTLTSRVSGIGFGNSAVCGLDGDVH